MNGELDKSDLNLSNIKIDEKIKEFKKMGLLTINDYSNDSRYSRNENFFEWIDKSDNLDPSKYQKKLNNATVLVVGLGGVGANVVEQLARIGVGSFILIDFDVIDSSNISRQSTYFEDDIGKYKNSVCSSYIKKINKKAKVKTINKKIIVQKDVDLLFEYSPDIVINCADKPFEIDRMFDKSSNTYNIPVVFGSYASTTINTIAKIPGKTIDISDFLDDNAITNDSIIDSSFPTSVIAPATFMVSGMISYYSTMILTGIRTPTEAIQIDMDGWDIFKYDISKK